MAAPTLIASYATNYTAAGSSKSVSITCSAGDALIVYATGDNNAKFNLPTATGLTFTTHITNLGDATYGGLGIYSYLFMPASTNLTVTVTEQSGTAPWGFTCVVMRGCYDIFDDSTNIGSGAPAINQYLVYPQHSAQLCVIVDASAQDGASRAWRTVDSNTPSSANGQELTYQYISGQYTTYAALYPDVSATGATGLSAPTGQTYVASTIQLSGTVAPTFLRSTSTGYGTLSTLSTSLTVNARDNKPAILAVASVGIAPASGTDTAITTTMTCNGTAMSSVAKVHANNGTQGYTEVFVATGITSGSPTLNLTCSTSVSLCLSAAVYGNVDQLNPVGSVATSYGSSSSPSMALTSTMPLTRALAFSALISGNNITNASNGSPSGLTANQTIINGNNNSSGGCTAMSSIIGLRDTQSVGWQITSGPWGLIGLTLNAVNYYPPGVVYGLGL